ncbi:MAG: hypothetical protein QOH62_2566 [Solirubrobacteraceae bacterium]|jgi:hypothetical protein|nr:hypothetical protein [Solirubrobacteraceae bacterium]
MFNTGQPPSMMEPTQLLGQFNEQILDATRAAAEMVLDMYEKTLDSIASYQEQAASQAEVDWIATAAAAQARFTRDVAKHHVSVGRELLLK